MFPLLGHSPRLFVREIGQYLIRSEDVTCVPIFGSRLCRFPRDVFVQCFERSGDEIN